MNDEQPSAQLVDPLQAHCPEKEEQRQPNRPALPMMEEVKEERTNFR
jgi:hypothetical protein